MIEGPYKSDHSGWVSRGIDSLDVIGLYAGFIAGCYFLGKAVCGLFFAGLFLKLAAVVGGAVALVGLFFIASKPWRFIWLFAFAILGPVLEYL